MKPERPLYFVMGVSGSGKTTLGKQLSEKLNLAFFDGDDYHPPENIKKMSEGKPLDDADREGWLLRLNALAKDQLGKGAVIACSALKEKYRNLLSQGLRDTEIWVYLVGSFKEIDHRIMQRKGHFMPSSLLKSQFRELEAPSYGIHIPVSLTTSQAVERILRNSNKGG